MYSATAVVLVELHAVCVVQVLSRDNQFGATLFDMCCQVGQFGWHVFGFGATYIIYVKKGCFCCCLNSFQIKQIAQAHKMLTVQQEADDERPQQTFRIHNGSICVKPRVSARTFLRIFPLSSLAVRWLHTQETLNHPPVCWFGLNHFASVATFCSNCVRLIFSVHEKHSLFSTAASAHPPHRRSRCAYKHWRETLLTSNTFVIRDAVRSLEYEVMYRCAYIHVYTICVSESRDAIDVRRTYVVCLLWWFGGGLRAAAVCWHLEMRARCLAKWWWVDDSRERARRLSKEVDASAGAFLRVCLSSICYGGSSITHDDDGASANKARRKQQA